MPDQKISQDATITGSQLLTATSEPYIPVIDPNEATASNRNKRMVRSEWGVASSLTLFNTYTDSITLALANLGKLVRMNKASANTVTVPHNDDVAFPIGAVIPIRQVGAGATTIVAASGVTVNGSTVEIPAQHTGCALHKVGTNEWDVWMGGAGELVPDVTAPTVTARATGSTTTILITFDESVVITDTTGWSAKKNGSALAISGVSGTGTNVLTFTVATMANGDTILISYNSGTGNTEDGSGNALASFTDQSVTNTIGDVTAPALVSATVENADPDKVVFVYDEALNASFVPANGDYSFSPAKTVTNVAVVGDTVTVTVSVPFANGDTIAANYTGTSSPDPLQDAAGNQAADLTSEAVTNNVAPAASYIAFTSDAPSNEITESPTGTWTAADAQGRGVATSESLAASANGWVQMQWGGAPNDSALLILDPEAGFAYYTDSLFAVYASGGFWRYVENSGAPVSTGVAPVSNQYVRLARSGGNTIKIETSPDQSTWTTIHTFTLTSSAELLPKLSILASGQAAKEVKGVGLT